MTSINWLGAECIEGLFGITRVTPIKAAWVGITLGNIVLMVVLAWRLWPQPFALYLGWTALMALGQGSRAWDEWSEVITVGATGWWLWHEMPSDRHGRQFVLGIGSVIVLTLFYSLPMPWPHYRAPIYFTRLYTTAGFFAVAVAICLLHWAEKEPCEVKSLLAIPWFGAVLVAGSQRGWSRWPVAITTNLIWAACLIGWLQYGRRSPTKVRSMTAS